MMPVRGLGLDATDKRGGSRDVRANSLILSETPLLSL
jgi:hypothetical protein